MSPFKNKPSSLLSCRVYWRQLVLFHVNLLAEFVKESLLPQLLQLAAALSVVSAP
jgi:hypothetical protein